MAGAPPFVVTLDAGRHTVQAWSVARLPFEPKGWLRELRAELRSALKRLRASDGRLLSATYGSPAVDYCDAENILIYNVGAGHMATASSSGIRVERSYDAPAPPRPLESDAHHYWRYAALDPEEPFQAWRELHSVASWNSVSMPALTEFTKPSTIWCALRTAPVEVGGQADPSRPFGLRLVLGVPPRDRVVPAEVVKPLVDGVIASLHSHDGTDLANVSTRLHAQLPGESTKRIGELLIDASAAALGPRRLVWPRAQSVQWNPADDFCVALELRVEPSDRLELSGRLMELRSRTACE